MKYRREVDGLRAVAVLPVIFFHAGFKAFSGGFIGVDVFFVISGYLITNIILAEMEQGKFSITNFYERRARRILPVLFFVMLCCIPFAWVWLLPNHLKDFSESLTAVSIFSSNILFWKESGYFDTAVELKPLLHTWSLAVEEQYYVLFPIFMILLWKLRKRWIFGTLMAIAIGSLALAQWGSYNKPSASFFLLPTRGWELAVGALVAFYFLYRKKQIEFVSSNKAASEFFGLIGLILIGYSIVIFDNSTPFPGFYALIPTIGTALIIIFSTSNTIVGRLLGTKIMVGIGLISYSAYLWHQPLFVFARHRSFAEPSTKLLIILSAISIILAYFSWRFIEIPFRDRNKISKNFIFKFSLIGSLFFIVIGFSGMISNGYSDRLPENLLELYNDDKSDNKEENSFMENNTNGKYIFLMGDSHAKALSGDLKNRINDIGIGFIYSTLGGCPPVENVYRRDKQSINCYEYNNDVYKNIISSKYIETIIVSARWTIYLDGSQFDNTEGGTDYGDPVILDLIINTNKTTHENNERKILVENMFYESIMKLVNSGKKIIIVYDVPECGWNPREIILKKGLFSDFDLNKAGSGFLSTGHDVFKKRTERTYKLFDKIGDHKNLFRIKPENVFCNNYVENRCVSQYDGEIFYKDTNHLSKSGSKLVVDQIMKYIN